MTCVNYIVKRYIYSYSSFQRSVKFRSTGKDQQGRRNEEGRGGVRLQSVTGVDMVTIEATYSKGKVTNRGRRFC